MATNCIIVKTKQGIFITDNVEDKSYFSSKIDRMKFDGETLKPSRKKYWYILKSIPVLVEKKESDTRVFKHFELKEGYPISDITPKILKTLNSEDERWGLYTRVNDTIEGQWVEEELVYDLLEEENDFFLDRPKYKYTSSLITELTVHPLVRANHDCSVPADQLYKIVREYIKQKIDLKYAYISSDYDFCLSVKKRIALTSPLEYLSTTSTGKKKKVITKYRNTREITVYEAAPKAYQSYPVLKPITASNVVELQEKVDKYLQDIITEINKPLKDCPHCEGLGVILKA